MAKKYYVGKYSTPYCGTEEYHLFLAESPREVEDWMEEGIYDYSSLYEYLVGEPDNFDSEEEYERAIEWYQDDCYYEVWEATEEDIYNYFNGKEDAEEI